jgi:hypothetical protein
MYAFAPKTAREVEAGIDAPFSANQLLEIGAHRIAPPFEPLKSVAGKIAVLSGVRVQTANHQTGHEQFLRMRTRTGGLMDVMTTLLAPSSDGPPLPSVMLGTMKADDYAPGWFGSEDSPDLVSFHGFRRLESMDPVDLEALAAALVRRAASFRTTGAAFNARSRNVAATQMEQVAGLYRRLRGVPPMREAPWEDAPGAGGLGPALQRALWLITHDLSSGVYIRAEPTDGPEWDTHTANDQIQPRLNKNLATQLSRFVQALTTTRNARGGLLDQTLLVMGSEIGRFPRLNRELGKDHFPEIALLFAGGAFNTREGKGARYGETGRQMEGLKVSLKTGRPAKEGTLLTLDDVGTTLLSMVGKNPRAFGYQGRELEFLRAS